MPASKAPELEASKPEVPAIEEDEYHGGGGYHEEEEGYHSGDHEDYPEYTNHMS